MTCSIRSIAACQVWLVCLAGGCSPDGGQPGGESDTATAADAGRSGGADSGSSGAGCDEQHPDWTVGLQSCSPDAFAGYTLLAPMGSTTTYLIDMFGREVHSWPSSHRPGLAVYLLENGNLLRTASTVGMESPFPQGGAGGRVEEIDWDGNVVWEYDCSSSDRLSHHDVERLPNGNTLIIAWETRTAAQAISAGRDPETVDDVLHPDSVIEVEPTGSSGGDVVWEWHAWDHLIQDHDPSKANYGVVADHPELIDINTGTSAMEVSDWNHLNAVDYDAELDQILLTSHTLSEIWIIDHDTTTAEAAGHSGGGRGHGGDLLYRWGNPSLYGAGSSQDRQLYAQHDAHWIEDGLPGAGDILIFDNGMGRPGGLYSSVDEIAPPVDQGGDYPLAAGAAFGPSELAWSYAADDPADFFAENISGAQRLPNGDTLVCAGTEGWLFEVTGEGDVVWSYVNPVTSAGVLGQGETVPTGPHGSTNTVFRAYRYPAEYPGLAGRDLTPGDYVEAP